MSPPGTSLSATSRPSTPSRPARLNDYLVLSHPACTQKACVVKPMSIQVEDGPDGSVPGILHLPSTVSATSASKTAAILLSGAGGGVVGPSAIYLSLADKLASLKQAVPALRLDYRYPARNKYCVRDVLAAMKQLEESYQIERFVLAEQLIGGFVLRCAGLDPRTDEDGLAEKLVGDEEKVELMEKGGDLRRNESVE
ncbi:unnamed protein product [Alternaria alternata]